MSSASWVDGVGGHIEAVVQAGASPVVLRAPDEVADFVSAERKSGTARRSVALFFVARCDH